MAIFTLRGTLILACALREIAQAMAPCEVRAVITAAIEEMKPNAWTMNTTANQIDIFFLHFIVTHHKGLLSADTCQRIKNREA